MSDSNNETSGGSELFTSVYNHDTKAYDYFRFDTKKLFNVKGNSTKLTEYGFGLLSSVLGDGKNTENYFVLSADNEGFELSKTGIEAYKTFITNQNIWNTATANDGPADFITDFEQILSRYADYEYEFLFEKDGSFTNRGRRALENYEFVRQSNVKGIEQDKSSWPNPPINNETELRKSPEFKKTGIYLSETERSLLSGEDLEELPEGPLFDVTGEPTPKGWGLILKRYWNDVYAPAYIKFVLKEENTVVEVETLEFNDIIEKNGLTDKGNEALGYFQGTNEIVSPKKKKNFYTSLESEFEVFDRDSQDAVFSEIKGVLTSDYITQQPLKILDKDSYDKENKFGIGRIYSQPGESLIDADDSNKDRKYNPYDDSTETLRRVDVLNYIANNKLEFEPEYSNYKDDISINFYPAKDSLERGLIDKAKISCDEKNKFESNPTKKLQAAGGIFASIIDPIAGTTMLVDSFGPQTYFEGKELRAKLTADLDNKLDRLLKYQKTKDIEDKTFSMNGSGKNNKPIDIGIDKKDFISAPGISNFFGFSTNITTKWIKKSTFANSLGFLNYDNLDDMYKKVVEVAIETEYKKIENTIDPNILNFLNNKDIVPITVFESLGYQMTTGDVAKRTSSMMIFSQRSENIFPEKEVYDKDEVENKKDFLSITPDPSLLENIKPVYILSNNDLTYNSQKPVLKFNNMKGSIRIDNASRDPDKMMIDTNNSRLLMNRIQVQR